MAICQANILLCKKRENQSWIILQSVNWEQGKVLSDDWMNSMYQQIVTITKVAYGKLGCLEFLTTVIKNTAD